MIRIYPCRSKNHPVGGLAWRPDRLSREVATAVCAQVAIAITRAIAIEANTRFEAVRESERLLARKNAALARLHEVGSLLWRSRDLRQALDEILAGAIELLGADMGTIRILDAQRGVLKVEAHRGFKQKALDSIDGVPAAGDSICGRVLRAGERMVIEDV